MAKNNETKLFTCHYCKLEHAKVECSGIYYCPNLLCTGPGAHYFRHSLDSYTEVEGGRHTVDEVEIVEKALAKINADPKFDQVVKAKILESVTKWLSIDVHGANAIVEAHKTERTI